MADRVDAAITIGGTLRATLYAELADVIAGEGLSTEWDGPSFEPGDRSDGEPLRLFAHEVAWGRFEDLEAWCVADRLPFARWSGACSGSFGAERVVFRGEGEPQCFAADEEDEIVLHASVARQLGSYEAIVALIEAAEFVIPPLVVMPDDEAA